MYCCKYCTKHGKSAGKRNVLYEIMDEFERKDDAAWEKYGDDFEACKLGSKLHRAFMSEIGEEQCQGEVAHHANRAPEYLCSRMVKHVYFYKKALALASVADDSGGYYDDDWVWQESEAHAASARKGRRITKPSDIELYESRGDYWFWPEGTSLCDQLPQADWTILAMRSRVVARPGG